MHKLCQERRKQVIPAAFVRRAVEGADGDGGMSRIVGVAAVYNQPYHLGDEDWGYKETIAPGAFAFDDDVVCTFNHNNDIPLGRQSNGTLRLTDGADGLSLYVAPNLETSYGRDVLALVARKDVKGMSITFSYWGDYGDYEYTEKSDGWDELLIKRATLFEAGPVLNPAYTQTTAEARSIGGYIRGAHQRANVDAWLAKLMADEERRKRADVDNWLLSA